ncbi:hypothetical protein GCM10008090_31960 [Arenicella chitinivorans]|uniref:Uncharacterized protein n=1 Tax=Arenicella chitinivorans TaxID=1329800 RepID=A0A918S4E9_9GAMM|nr:hypothetical protein [Arenicella chitinivorans]GHA19836.1 hypothetical protein GCM10008090_31960 [Arenicella chitinivorans]
MKKLLRTLTFLTLSLSILNANAGFPDDLSDVVFTEAPQVKSWPVGASMNLSIGNGVINMPFNATNSWPGISIYGTRVNANAWGIVKENGIWKAGTWEWLRPGQTTKKQSAWQRGHFRFIRDISPKNGDIFGFFVSGTARGGQPTNIARRSNFVVYEWGKGVISIEGQTAPEVKPSFSSYPAIDLLLDDAN